MLLELFTLVLRALQFSGSRNHLLLPCHSLNFIGLVFGLEFKSGLRRVETITHIHIESEEGYCLAACLEIVLTEEKETIKLIC